MVSKIVLQLYLYLVYTSKGIIRKNYILILSRYKSRVKSPTRRHRVMATEPGVFEFKPSSVQQDGVN